jgi:tetratricopeptide (TPR) repeat protein
VGNFREASKAAEAALMMAPNRNTQILAAIVLAQAGKEDGARATLGKLDSAFPLDTVMQAYWLPSIRAAIQLNRGHAAQAIDALQPTIPYELGNPPPASILYPVCLRGQALLLSHQGAAASVEFQKVLAHRSLTNFVLGALANLQLGRAYAMSGDTDKAKSAYQDFLTLWKDADANIPVLTQAKAEYGRLTTAR